MNSSPVDFRVPKCLRKYRGSVGGAIASVVSAAPLSEQRSLWLTMLFLLLLSKVEVCCFQSWVTLEVILV